MKKVTSLTFAIYIALPCTALSAPATIENTYDVFSFGTHLSSNRHQTFGLSGLNFDVSWVNSSEHIFRYKYMKSNADELPSADSSVTQATLSYGVPFIYQRQPIVLFFGVASKETVSHRCLNTCWDHETLDNGISLSVASSWDISPDLFVNVEGQVSNSVDSDVFIKFAYRVSPKIDTFVNLSAMNFQERLGAGLQIRF